MGQSKKEAVKGKPIQELKLGMTDQDSMARLRGYLEVTCQQVYRDPVRSVYRARRAIEKGLRETMFG